MVGGIGQIISTMIFQTTKVQIVLKNRLEGLSLAMSVSNLYLIVNKKKECRRDELIYTYFDKQLTALKKDDCHCLQKLRMISIC